MVDVAARPIRTRGLVVRQDIGALDQAELAGHGEGFPEPRLAAEGAIAAAGAGTKIKIGLEANRPAMAASVIGLLHRTASGRCSTALNTVAGTWSRSSFL